MHNNEKMIVVFNAWGVVKSEIIKSDSGNYYFVTDCTYSDVTLQALSKWKIIRFFQIMYYKRKYK